MQLMLFSDLSLRVIALMAVEEPGRKYTAAEVTESLNASRVHVSKVVSRLVELGFSDMVKGRNGGIYLRDSVMDKPVGKLLRTLENNEVVNCIGTDYPLLPMCLLRGELAATQEAFSTTPDPVLITDLIPVKPIDGVDGDTSEGDSVPRGSMLSIRPVQMQS